MAKIRFDHLAEVGAVAHRLAQHIAGRDVGDLQAFSQQLRLCPLAGSRSSDHHQAHRSIRKCRTRDARGGVAMGAEETEEYIK